MDGAMTADSVAAAIYRLLSALWLGSLVGIGGIAAPVLFAQLSDRVLAGNLAGALFTVESWVGIACGSGLLVCLFVRHGAAALRGWPFRLVCAMLAIVCVGHFGIQPWLAQLKQQALPLPVMDSSLRGQFALWHGVSSGLYLLQTVFGAVLVMLPGRAVR
jgi:hypothetical protein